MPFGQCMTTTILRKVKTSQKRERERRKVKKKHKEKERQREKNADLALINIFFSLLKLELESCCFASTNFHFVHSNKNSGSNGAKMDVSSGCWFY